MLLVIVCTVLVGIGILWALWPSSTSADDVALEAPAAAAAAAIAAENARKKRRHRGGRAGGGGSDAMKKPGGKHATPARKRWVKRHDRFLNALRGHTDDITAMSVSPKGNAVLTASIDSTLRWWNTAKLQAAAVAAADGNGNGNGGDKVSTHALSGLGDTPYARVNLDGDIASAVAWKRDGVYCAVALQRATNPCIRIYGCKSEAHGDSERLVTKCLHEFEATEHGGQTVTVLDFCSSADGGGCIISLCDGDGPVCVWSLKGELLRMLKNNQLHNFRGAVSADGAWFCCGTKRKDTKLWRMHDVVGISKGKSSKEREFVALTGKGGHSSSVMDASFDPGTSTLLGTALLDGSFRIWSLKVGLGHGELPHVVSSVRDTGLGSLSCICMAPPRPEAAEASENTRRAEQIVAVAGGCTIQVYRAMSGEKLCEIVDAHGDRRPIRTLQFSDDGRILFSHAQGGRTVCMFRVPGWVDR